ncbi:MAG: putative glycoside hydrolase [bacterium]
MIPRVLGIYGLKSDGSQFPGMSDSVIAKQLKNWGITAVFGGYDNSKLATQLHQNGISIYTEIAIFTGEKYWNKYPESRPITDQGLPLEKDDWYAGVCPTHGEIRQERLTEIEQLCKIESIDGIWLDFIRYPCHWEVKQPRFDHTCFCQDCLAKFQKDTKIVIPNHLSNPAEKAKWLLNVKHVEWNKWRCQQITEFAHQARKLIKKEKPNIPVGLFGVPWRETDFNYAIIEYIGQDYTALAKDIDIFSPMVYHKMCGQPVSWITEITRYLSEKTKRPVIPIVQAGNNSEPISSLEFEQIVEAGLTESSNGTIIFTLDDYIKQKALTT